MGTACCILAALVLPQLASASNVNVDISNFSFQPPSVSIHTGDSVTWTQKDSTQHTSTSDAGVWNSPFLSLSQTFSRTFDTAGDFPYHCTPHPFMTGSVTVQAAAANQPPTVTISSPSDGATLTDPNVTIQANPSDPDGSIAKVQFFDRRTLLGVATSPPYQVTAMLAVGSHNLSAQATDNLGAVGTSSPVAITIAPAANVPPTVSLTQPTDGQSFVSPVNIPLSANAADSDGSVSKVEFMADGNSLGVATSAPFNFTWNNVSAGTYALTAVATDNSGATTTSSAVHITVSPPQVTPPTVTLSGPVRTADGKFQIMVSGADGHSLQLQGSSDLANWETLQTIAASDVGQPIIDAPPAGLAQRFYRVQVQ